eukprot:TRINITY_DN4109_c0_g1_i1.p1 TRINITY_DN4109_c0_g1~~TRINITY_DN4109_c0_g1_i1.p1  ORF type:complete len:1208 (+),score=307.47 TRINITY_DN4109_c0_g1_i1:125-3748(+)
MAASPSLDYGDLGWIKISDYPFWPVRRADITEAPLDVRKLGREELMLVYFFGVHSYAWVAPEKARLWDEAIEKQNEAQRRGKLLQSALDEAYEWQKDFLKKKFSTRRRSSAQPNDKRSDVPASLMSEIKTYRRALDHFMKQQDKEWRETRKKGGVAGGPDEVIPESTPNIAIVSPENVLPADTPKRTAKVVAADLLNMAASSEKIRANPKPKSPLRKAGKQGAKVAKSIASSSSSIPPPTQPSPADVVAEMLKTEEADDSIGVLESLAAFASAAETTMSTATVEMSSNASIPPASTLEAHEELDDVDDDDESLPAPAPVFKGPGRRRGSGKKATSRRGGKRSFSSDNGPASASNPAASQLESERDAAMMDAMEGVLFAADEAAKEAGFVEADDSTAAMDVDELPNDDDDDDVAAAASVAAASAPASSKKRRSPGKPPAIVADGYSDSEQTHSHHHGRPKKSASVAAAAAVPDEILDPSQQNCPMCGNAAHLYHEEVVDSTAEKMAMEHLPHDRAENVSVGRYMFFMMETHFADIATEQKRFCCPYPHCEARFSIEFELKKHIDSVHLTALQNNMMLQTTLPTQTSSSSSSSSASAADQPAYSISLDCDYMGCNATFPGTEAGRLERRRHIESAHLQLHRHSCECCGSPVYGTEANERRRQAEMAGVPMKRGRGRPRKYPRPGESLPMPQPLLGPDGLPIKRGRGRPRKYPRGSHLNQGDLSGSELSHDYDRRDASPIGGGHLLPSSNRYRRGPGRPRKGSGSAHYGGDSSAYSGSESEMEPSSISGAGPDSIGPGRSRGHRRSRHDNGGESGRSRSGSPARRGPGRPRKYPRDEFGHPIKPSSGAGALGRAAKRRKLNPGVNPLLGNTAVAETSANAPPAATAAEKPTPTTASPAPTPAISVAVSSSSEEQKVAVDAVAPSAPAPLAPPAPVPRTERSSSLSSSSAAYKRRGRPPKHPTRHGNQINPMEGMTMRQQLKLAAMHAQMENKAAASLEAAAKAGLPAGSSPELPRSRLVGSNALVIPPGATSASLSAASAKGKKLGKKTGFVPPPPSGAAKGATSPGLPKRMYKEFQDDDDDDIEDDADEDYDDGTAPPPRNFTPKRQAPTRTKPAPPSPVQSPHIPASSILGSAFPSIVEAASDVEMEDSEETISNALPAMMQAQQQVPATAAATGGGLDLFFGLVDLAASIDTSKQALGALAAPDNKP